MESLQSYSAVFSVLQEFLNEHASIEIDVCEAVLNGGWEALEHNRVDLVVGSPGPVPLQKGYRAIPLANADLVPVIASHHELAGLANSRKALEVALPGLRRIITHDTSTTGVTRSAGLSSDGQKLYVQNTDLKAEAILAGLGIGHLPRHRIQQHLNDGRLIQLNLSEDSFHENFLAWKINNRGKGMQALTQRLLVELS